MKPLSMLTAFLRKIAPAAIACVVESSGSDYGLRTKKVPESEPRSGLNFLVYHTKVLSVVSANSLTALVAKRLADDLLEWPNWQVWQDWNRSHYFGVVRFSRTPVSGFELKSTAC